MILTIRTDKPEAELGLFDNQGKKITYKVWQAHRQLSDTILIKIEEALTSQNATYSDIQGLVFYKGPGSFTGLRIGASVANAIGYAQKIPTVGKTGDDWIQNGLNNLNSQKSEPIVPLYGAEPHITQQKK